VTLCELKPINWADITVGISLVTLRVSDECHLSIDGPYKVIDIDTASKHSLMGSDGEQRYFREIGCPTPEQKLVNFHRTFIADVETEAFLQTLVRNDAAVAWLTFCQCEEPVQYISHRRQQRHIADHPTLKLFDCCYS
jgi:hypothetical protein